MAKIARIGMDTSKSVFQLHGVDDEGRPVLRRKLRRQQMLAFFAGLEPTEVGLETCGGSQHWARELGKLGHRAVLIPAQHVRPYVGRNKNDAADAEAICEAMSRPRVRQHAVAVKSADQTALQMLLAVRESLLRRRTQLGNAIRGHAAEFGLVAPKGLARLEALLAAVAAGDSVPDLAKEMFATLGQQLADLGPRIEAVERRLMAWHRGNEQSRRLAEVPGVGPITASLLAAKIPDPGVFRSGRMCAAWIGLTARDHSSGGKQRLGGITRAGDERLRAVLVAGATAYIQQVRRGRSRGSAWLTGLLARKPPKLAAVALANKTARIAWRMMVSGERYQSNRMAAVSAA